MNQHIISTTPQAACQQDGMILIDAATGKVFAANFLVLNLAHAHEDLEGNARTTAGSSFAALARCEVVKVGEEICKCLPAPKDAMLEVNTETRESRNRNVRT